MRLRGGVFADLTGVHVTDQVRIGVAGAGVFGGYHASKYAAHPQAALVGVFDPDAEKTAALSSRFQCRAFDDFPQLIADIDALIVASPATAHFDQALYALRHGKHVFVEKPMALHHNDALELERRARSSGLVLQVGHQERFLLQSIGLFESPIKFRKIRSVRAAPRSGRCEDVSVVYDLMIHDIDFARALTGAPAATISAQGDANRVDAQIVLVNGVEIEFRASREAPALTRTLEIECGAGKIFVDFVSRRIENLTAFKLDTDFLTPKDGAPFDPLSLGAAHFIASVLAGAPIAVTGAEGALAIEWAEAIEAARLETAGPAKVESVSI